ncbi:MAG TPA: hypothetical protein VH394_12520 [Thermoanaerobaculia bacterium]|jgi:hypothetical protein|nr:hypothetical protein [Thermoanaerobaculia bacterium]
MNTKALKLLALAVIALMSLVPAAWAGKTGTMSTPILSCGAITSVSFDVGVCAGVTGAPAGFSLQWITAAQLANGPDGIAGTLDDNTWPLSESLDLCKASFSGNANGSSYNLAASQCISVQLGDNLFDDPGASSNCPSVPLACGTTYAVRGFAHATSSLNRSAFTPNLFCATEACETSTGCTYTQGYWKTHGPIPTGNNVNEWAVTSLTLGSVVYTDLQLQSIFDQSAAGNGLVSLAHQLIAAKLNIASGADDSSIAGAIASADALIGGLMVPPVGAGSLPPSATSALTSALTLYNQGDIGPGHCE